MYIQHSLQEHCIVCHLAYFKLRKHAQRQQRMAELSTQIVPPVTSVVVLEHISTNPGCHLQTV